MNKPLFPDVTVNGRMISAADIAAEAQNHAAPKGKPGLAWRQAAKALVIRHLLLEEVGRIGMVAEPEDLGDQRFETQEEADIRALMEAGMEPAPVLARPKRDRSMTPIQKSFARRLFTRPRISCLPLIPGTLMPGTRRAKRQRQSCECSRTTPNGLTPSRGLKAPAPLVTMADGWVS